MEASKFKVGDKVKIVSNQLQREYEGQVGTVKKAYHSFNKEKGYGYVYRVQVNGTTLKGVACDENLELVE